MKKACLPICRYPTTVVCVDDSVSWLQGVSREIEVVAPCKTFDRAETVMNFLEGRTSNSFAERCQTIEEGSHIPSLQINKIVEEVFSAARFEDIGVMFIDYQMPGKTGVELCKDLENFSAKKILLTAEADESIAVDAFNDKVIDAYIKKSDPDLANKIMQSISQFSNSRFQELSESIIAALSHQEEPLSSCFFDKEFADFFNALLKEKEITEYYFVSAPANFLLIDREGNHSWFAIRDEADLTHDIDWLVDQLEEDEGNNDELIKQVKNKQCLDFSCSLEGGEEEQSDVSDCIHSCDKVALSNGKAYYYSLIPGKSQQLASEIKRMESSVG